ncbi:MAG: preprotein translocase subunit YajC [Oscillospiraceae bacterium]|nr:preprotein translocase subunit YajC [Oscillospiraceae bacterium]
MWLFLAAEGGGMGGLLGTMLLPIGLLAVMYFFMIRPESKRKKAAAKMRNELIVGDQVTTIGGITGKVVSIKDDQVTVETGADRVRIHVMRWAISSKGQQISE